MDAQDLAEPTHSACVFVTTNGKHIQSRTWRFFMVIVVLPTYDTSFNPVVLSFFLGINCYETRLDGHGEKAEGGTRLQYSSLFSAVIIGKKPLL